MDHWCSAVGTDFWHVQLHYVDFEVSGTAIQFRPLNEIHIECLSNPANLDGRAQEVDIISPVHCVVSIFSRKMRVMMTLKTLVLHRVIHKTLIPSIGHNCAKKEIVGLTPSHRGDWVIP